MCGITGQLNTDRTQPVNRAILGQMNAVIQHRGPDSQGVYLKGNIGLAMRRLAIIDLTDGEQPMTNEDGTVWIVFNGEIYNAPLLRPQLEARGHRFRSRSDTEVILHLYEEDGPDCVKQLRGMFAFAIWDEKRQRVLIARDRVGQKPLYYTEQAGVFLFGSELKCLLQHPSVVREVDLEAIHHYLTLQYVPSPWTAFRHIHKLPPAHRLLWQNGRVHIERYWELPYEPKWQQPEAELKEQLRETVREAVRIRLLSDVPLGAHLSGGIDSSIIVGLMTQLMDRPVQTFSIGFKEDAFSELGYAQQAAQQFQSDHHEFLLEPNALKVLPHLVHHFDEPFADPAAIPTWYLAQLTRQHVTVALNGDGGDEAFGGYQRYYADVLANAYQRVPSFLRRGVCDRVLHALPVRTDRPLEKSPIMAVRRLAQAASMSQAASVIRWGSYFTETEKKQLYHADVRQVISGLDSALLLEETFQHAAAANALDRTLYTDVMHYLPGALLPKVDRMSMAHSVEARSPFLDHHVMELAARLPRHWKVRGRHTKRILRDIFSDLVPEPIRTRGKHGFNVPLDMWFRGELSQAVHDILLSSNTQLRTYLRTDEVARVVDMHMTHRADNGKRLWALLNLEIWLQQCVRSAVPIARAS